MGEKKTLIRVVLDTNVVISALILRGVSNRVYECWCRKDFVWIVSSAIMKEYLRVLTYPKFQLSADEIARILKRQILPYVTVAKVGKVAPVVLKDPSDDIFLAAAKSAECAYIVSGDAHLLSLKKYGAIRILSISEFLEVLPHA